MVSVTTIPVRPQPCDFDYTAGSISHTAIMEGTLICKSHFITTTVLWVLDIHAGLGSSC